MSCNQKILQINTINFYFLVIVFQVIYNPYEDFTTQKINQILAEGGFAPEWIMLKRDIENEKAEIRSAIQQKSKLLFARQNLTPREREEWKKFLGNLSDKEVKKLNVSIDRFNLMVPLLNAQMVHFNLDREAQKISQNVISEVKAKPNDEYTKVQPELTESKTNFFGDFLVNLFFKKWQSKNKIILINFLDIFLGLVATNQLLLLRDPSVTTVLKPFGVSEQLSKIAWRHLLTTS